MIDFDLIIPYAADVPGTLFDKAWTHSILHTAHSEDVSKNTVSLRLALSL